MLTVAVLQQKGGAGKTTLAINLAAAAHLRGLRTLIVDMDKQASAFDWSAQRADGSKLEGLAVVRADRALALPRMREVTKGYDCVLLDGPPRLGDVTSAAAVAADLVLLPIQPGPFDFWAVEETVAAVDHADQVREQLGLPPVRRGLVLNRAATGTRLARVGALELERASAENFGVVHQRVAFQESAARGESVFTIDSAKDAAFDISRLWRAISKGHVNDDGIEPQETQPRESRKEGPRRRGEARRGAEEARC